MIDNLPVFISLTFGLTTVATLLLFVWAIRNSTSATTRSKSTVVLIGLLTWLVIQFILAANNTYNTDLTSFPPTILLYGIAPTVVVIVFLFITQKGREFIDSLPLNHGSIVCLD